jgi:hypothetical protein
MVRASGKRVGRLAGTRGQSRGADRDLEGLPEGRLAFDGREVGVAIQGLVERGGSLAVGDRGVLKGDAVDEPGGEGGQAANDDAVEAARAQLGLEDLDGLIEGAHRVGQAASRAQTPIRPGPA